MIPYLPEHNAHYIVLPLGIFFIYIIGINGSLPFFCWFYKEMHPGTESAFPRLIIWAKSAMPIMWEVPR